MGTMIQSTTRLSRGARLRRPRSLWIYGVVALTGLGVAVIIAWVLKP